MSAPRVGEFEYEIVEPWAVVSGCQPGSRFIATDSRTPIPATSPPESVGCQLGCQRRLPGSER